MANKRMFSKSITCSSRFLMMPASAQCLYFHLGMNADDDGFCEHFVIMRMTESKPDDLRILQAKKFIKIFDDKVLIILDWKENNYIRADRYSKSKYLELYKEELKLINNKCHPVGIPDDNQTVDNRETQIRSDQVRSDKIRSDKINKSKKKKSKKSKKYLDYPDINAYRENVRIRETDYNTLLSCYEKNDIEKMFDKLSSYKLAHGKEYASDYGAIHQWVIESLKIKKKNKEMNFDEKL